MESESAGDSGAAREEPIVFISDASAEAERVSVALSARGWTVADVPLALLAGRTAVQRPAVVICDADADGASDALTKIRQQSPENPVAVVVVGERDGAIASIDVALVRAVFARPVNIPELVGTVERLVRGVSENGSLLPPRKLGTSSRPPARPPAQSVAPLKPASIRADPLGENAFALPPELAGEPVATRGTPSEAPVVELSGEIQALLLAAERRLGGKSEAPSSRGDDPGPEVDFEAALPPEVLAALEDPLDEDDELERSSAPEPDPDGTASLTMAKGDRPRGHTQGGGTFATALGTDATGMPPSEPGHTSPANPMGTGVQAPNESRHPDGLEPGDSAEAKRQRQQASTPKPPKPGAEDLMTSDSPDGAPIHSLPPPTAYDPTPPAAHSRSPRSRAEAFGESTPRSDPPSSAGPSTSPPLRGTRAGTLVDQPGALDDRASERPDAGRTILRGASELPSSPFTGEGRDSELPSAPRPPESDRGSAPRAAFTPDTFAIPPALRTGDAAVTLAKAIRARFTGALAFEVDEGIRRVVLREGDFVTAASGVHGEALVAFLAARGDVPPEVARQGHKLPAFGRRAGAALIAHGHLVQDQLWPVLRAHAEWIIGKVVGIERGAASIEPLGRLEDEPAVFGGATGAEVLVEVVRRVLPPEEAVSRLGGLGAVLAVGPARNLLEECALPQQETERVLGADGASLGSILEGTSDPSLASVIYALVALGGLSAAAPRPDREGRPAPPPRDEIDDEAMRARILSRKALVDEGDYFAVLGVARSATAYDIRRAYTALRSEFEPSRALSAQTADLRDVVSEIIEVLDEAYEILSDNRRRERYRRAIEATP